MSFAISVVMTSRAWCWESRMNVGRPLSRPTSFVILRAYCVCPSNNGAVSAIFCARLGYAATIWSMKADICSGLV